VQPLTIFGAQTRARFSNILTPLANMFASLVQLSAFFRALALLRTLLVLTLALGVALLRVSVIRAASFLLGAPLFGRALFALALFTLGGPLMFLPLWLGPTIWLVLMNGSLRTSAMLRLIPARAAQLPTGTT